MTLDPNRPTPQVSNIAQSILSELDRVRGTQLKLTLNIDAETPEGFRSARGYSRCLDSTAAIECSWRG